MSIGNQGYSITEILGTLMFLGTMSLGNMFYHIIKVY